MRSPLESPWTTITALSSAMNFGVWANSLYLGFAVLTLFGFVVFVLDTMVGGSSSQKNSTEGSS